MIAQQNKGVIGMYYSLTEQITNNHARYPGSIPADAIQGLSLAHSNSINQYNHKQTTINELQCSQGIVYPRYTYNSQYTIMIT